MKDEIKTKTYFLEELFNLVVDNETCDEIETQCQELDEKMDEIFMGSEELSDIFTEAVYQHELREFALGVEVAQTLTKKTLDK